MDNIPDVNGELSLEEVPVVVPVTVPVPIPVPLPLQVNADGVKYQYSKQPDVLMDSIKDGVVSKSTLACYIAEIFSLLSWMKEHNPTVLTTHGYFCIESYQEQSPGLNTKILFQKYKTQFHGELRNARTIPLFEEDLLTADLYMDYLSRQRHTRAFLSKLAYGVKKACAFHLFRLHNGSGFPPVFNSNITNLLKGFFRVLTARKGVAQSRVRGVAVNVPVDAGNVVNAPVEVGFNDPAQVI
jgi:hypothetical protein